MDEAEVGRQLRATTERVAKEAAADAVRIAAMEALRPTLEGMARIRVDLDNAAARLEKHGEALTALDGERLGHDYAEMMAAQGRLEAARGEILADLAKVRDGIAAATAEGVANAVGQLQEYLVRAVSDEVSRVSPEVVKAARDEMREGVTAEIEATRAVCAAMIEAAETRIAIKLVPSVTLKDIRDARGRPARRP